jgi:PKD repeat protein
MKNSLKKASVVFSAVLVGSFLFAGILAAQTAQIEWVRQFGTIAPQNDWPQTIDAQGNIYLAGYSSYAKDFGFLYKFDPEGNEIWKREVDISLGSYYGQSVCTDQTGIYVAGGSYAIHVWKYDFDGNQLWNRSYSGTSISRICADGSSIYIAGPITGASPNERNIVIRKCDTSGNEIWTRQFGTVADDVPQGICVYTSSLYISGNTLGSFPGYPQNSGGWNVFVSKYDLQGNALWTRQIINPDQSTSICADASGAYVLGYGHPLPGQPSYGSADVFVSKYDLVGNEIWTRTIGSSYYDSSAGICTDASGIYISGRVINGNIPGQTGPGGGDAFVRKYDSNGNMIWTRQFGTSSQDSATAISVCPTGVYVTGDTNGSFPGFSIAGTKDGFLRKYDTNGGEVWTRQFGSIAPARDDAFAVDIHGNLYIGGTTGGILPGQPSAGTDSDAFIRKYDANGDELWTRQFSNSTGGDDLRGLCVDESGVYASGSYNDPLGSYAFVRKFNFDGDAVWFRSLYKASSQTFVLDVCAAGGGIYIVGYMTGGYPGQPTYGGADVFIQKYDVDGNEIWTRQYGTPFSDSATSIAADLTGVYITGKTYSQPNYECFLWKYDENGNLIWDRSFGTASDDSATAVCTDATGIYVTGSTYGSFPGQTNYGSGDAFVRKYDAAGNELWTRQFGGQSNDWAYGIETDSQGIYIVGNTLGIQAPRGSWDAFIQAYNADGNALWTYEFGTTAIDYAFGVAVDSMDIYVIGSTYGGTFPGQDGDGSNQYDAFVAKINKPDLAPTADAEAPGEANIGIPVVFNGTGSSDPDGTIVSYHWDFGDNTYAYGVLVNHAYAAKGTYHGALTVTDDRGATGRDYFTVTVANSPPVAEAGQDIQVPAGQPAQFNGGASIDPDGTIVRYQWNFGDGATGEGPMPTHVYTDKVTYPVTLTVIDNEGATASDTLTVTVVNTPPVANAGPDLTVEGTGATTSFTLNGAGSSDPDGDQISYKWQDSNGNVIGTTPTLGLSRMLGSYTFTLTVTDTDNATSSDPVSVTIRDTTPPTITAPANIVIDMSDPYGTLVNLGLPTVTDICDPNPTIHVSFSGLFQLGETTVTWTATDHSGNVATAQQTITVEWGSPANQLSNLTKLIEYSVAAGKIDLELETSLLAKVAAASAAIARADANYAKTAMNDLKALVNQVDAQTDKKITPDIATEIIAWANRVITDLGG